MEKIEEETSKRPASASKKPKKIVSENLDEPKKEEIVTKVTSNEQASNLTHFVESQRQNRLTTGRESQKDFDETSSYMCS